eukprot:scaffold785_cov85-Isochrysis_galbana.AAC.4
MRRPARGDLAWPDRLPPAECPAAPVKGGARRGGTVTATGRGPRIGPWNSRHKVWAPCGARRQVQMMLGLRRLALTACGRGRHGAPIGKGGRPRKALLPDGVCVGHGIFRRHAAHNTSPTLLREGSRDPGILRSRDLGIQGSCDLGIQGSGDLGCGGVGGAQRQSRALEWMQLPSLREGTEAPVSADEWGGGGGGRVGAFVRGAPGCGGTARSR